MRPMTQNAAVHASSRSPISKDVISHSSSVDEREENRTFRVPIRAYGVHDRFANRRWETVTPEHFFEGRPRSYPEYRPYQEYAPVQLRTLFYYPSEYRPSLAYRSYNHASLQLRPRSHFNRILQSGHQLPNNATRHLSGSSSNLPSHTILRYSPAPSPPLIRAGPARSRSPDVRHVSQAIHFTTHTEVNAGLRRASPGISSSFHRRDRARYALPASEDNKVRHQGCALVDTVEANVSDKVVYQETKHCRNDDNNDSAGVPHHKDAQKRLAETKATSEGPFQRRAEPKAIPIAHYQNCFVKSQPEPPSVSCPKQQHTSKKPRISDEYNTKPATEFDLLDLLCSASLQVSARIEEGQRCSCPRSKCIKLYCECFQAGRRCSSVCSCKKCKNTVLESSPNGERTKAIQNILSRNPHAFVSKDQRVKLPEKVDGVSCRCVKSACLKLYCDCFQSGEVCTDYCSCIRCLNTDEESGENGRRILAIEMCLERKPDSFEKKIKVVGGGCACKNSRCLKKYCDCFNVGVACSDKCSCRECSNLGTSAMKAKRSRERPAADGVLNVESTPEKNPELVSDIVEP